MTTGRHSSSHKSLDKGMVAAFTLLALIWGSDALVSDNAVWARVLYGFGSLYLFWLVGSELRAVRQSRRSRQPEEPAE